MKADFRSLLMPTRNFGVSWSMKPPFRRALHCGLQRVFKQGSKMNGFCLKQGQGLKASTLAAHPHPNFPKVPPPWAELQSKVRFMHA